MAEHEAPCSYLKGVDARRQEIERRITKQENGIEHIEKDVKALFTSQEGTKVYVETILKKIDQLETKLYSYMTSLAATSDKDRHADRTERQQSTDKWIELFKYVLAVTLGAVVSQVFKGGGTP